MHPKDFSATAPNDEYRDMSDPQHIFRTSSYQTEPNALNDRSPFRIGNHQETQNIRYDEVHPSATPQQYYKPHLSQNKPIQNDEHFNDYDGRVQSNVPENLKDKNGQYSRISPHRQNEQYWVSSRKESPQQVSQKPLSLIHI